MALALTINDIVEMRVWFTQAEQAAVITFHYVIVSSNVGQVVTDQDAGRNFDAAIATGAKALLSTDATYRGVSSCVISRIPRPQAQIISTQQGPGGAAPPDLPRQVSGLISWITTLAGRAYRGRTYWPFPATGMNQTDGIPTTAYQTSLGNLANAILSLQNFSNLASTGTIQCELALFHRARIPQPFVPPTPITGYLIRPRWATQRRRGSFGRSNTAPF